MRSLALYEQAFRTAFRNFYGDPAGLSLYALLPNYLRRKGSSLVYMADRLIADCGSGGFYLDDCEGLLAAMERDPKPKILLGVSYALWDLAERYAPKLRDTVVMETGGMKGYREEIPKVPPNPLRRLRGRGDSFGIRHGRTHLAGLFAGRQRVPLPGLDARHGTRRQRPVRPAPGRRTRRAEHRGSGFLVVVRLYPDTGRGARRRGRRVRHRRPHRPLRHPRLQPAGTMKYRLKYQECIAVPNAVPTAFRRVSNPPHPSPPRAGVECRQAAKCRYEPLYKLSDSMKTVAFVPIRLNSQRVAGKNLRSLSGSPADVPYPENPD